MKKLIIVFGAVAIIGTLWILYLDFMLFPPPAGKGGHKAMSVSEALTPPAQTPMLQWNPNAVSGKEAWLYVLLIAALIAIVVILWIRKFNRLPDDYHPLHPLD